MTTPITASPFSFEHRGIDRLSTAADHLQHAAGRLDGVRMGMASRVWGIATDVSTSLRKHYGAWSQARRQEQEDQRTWELALQDARMMADLSRAMSAAARQR